MPLEVADRPKDAPPQKKRGPLVPIPADAPKRPDPKDMRAAIEKIYEEINGYKAKIADMRKKPEEEDTKTTDPRQVHITEKQNLIKAKVTLTESLTKLRGDRNDLQKQVTNIRANAREQEKDIRSLNKEMGNLMTVEQINAKIKELEFKLDVSGASTVKGERQIMKEIKQLQSVREKASQMSQKAVEISGSRSEEDSITLQVKAKQAEIDEKTAELHILIKQIEDKQAEINAHSGEAKKAREERDKISVQITEAYKKIDVLRADFEKKKQAYDEWKEDYEKKYAEAKEKLRKEREEEDRKRHEKQKEQELLIAAIKRLNPYEDEIANCESLIGYLKAKIAFQARDDRKTEAKPTHFDPTQAAAKGLSVLKKEDEDDWLFGSSSNKKKVNAPKPKPKVEPKDKPAEIVVKSKPMSHNSEKLAAFEALGVPVPKNTADVKAVLEELKKKKEHWESFKKTEKQALEEEKAEREAAAAKKAAEATEES